VDASALLYLAAGGAALLASLLPRLIDRLPLSMPMVFLGLGMVSFALLPGLPAPDPLHNGEAVERVSELCVIVALFGAGLALDRPVGRRRWASTWRLLSVGMLLTTLGVAVLGWWWLGLGVASAVLLAGVLAPTDPVLASDVQVGEPTAVEPPDDAEDEPRFALTSEAGLNDGLAFPAVALAVSMALHGTAPAQWAAHWLLVDVGWRIAAGVVVGVAVGWLLGRLFFHEQLLFAGVGRPLADEMEGFVALAGVFIAYGVAEMIHGYGFVAVFVCACAVRASERSHGYHAVMHSFTDQVERLLTAGILLLLGGAIARGLLSGLGMAEVLLAAAVLLVVRPVAGWLSLLGSRVGPRDRWVIAFFGVRGIGSVYYLAYALNSAPFDDDGQRLWAVTGLVILASVFLHGATATPIMRRIDRVRHRERVQTRPTHPDGAVTV
jgi:NhaP-type Na+/H+ or K+/H+ antiporter